VAVATVVMVLVMTLPRAGTPQVELCAGQLNVRLDPLAQVRPPSAPPASPPASRNFHAETQLNVVPVMPGAALDGLAPGAASSEPKGPALFRPRCAASLFAYGSLRPSMFKQTGTAVSCAIRCFMTAADRQALDDVVVKWSDVAHLHSLQLVRWSAFEYFLVR
jgi:hypothetical protein